MENLKPASSDSSQPKVPTKTSVDKRGETSAQSGLDGQNMQDMLVHLFNQHYSSLVRLASFLLDDTAVCEEVVQDAFVKMHTIKNLPEAGKEAAYLRSVVLNNARSRMRRRMVHRRAMAKEVKEPPAYTPSLETEVVNSAERRRIVQLLRKLPRRQAEVLTLRFYMDLSEEEISQTLNITKGSVKTHTSRGLDKMASLLEDGGSQKSGSSS